MTGDAAAGGQKCTATTACTGLGLSCADRSDCPTDDICCISLSLAGLGGGAGGVSGNSSCKTTCGTGFGTCQLCLTDSECSKGVTCQSTGMGGSICGGIMACAGGAGGALGGTLGGTLGGGGLLGG
jgi:hypothetical protein